MLVDRAQLVASERLADMPERLAHVGGVARAVQSVGLQLMPEQCARLVAAAWVHDIGYAHSIAKTGFHPLDGAVFLRDHDFPVLLVSLVAFHSGSVVEAEERGLAEQLSAFAPPPSELLDLLTFADMTTGPDGSEVDAGDRVAEILNRYVPDEVVHRSVARSAPDLLATVARVRSLLATV